MVQTGEYAIRGFEDDRAGLYELYETVFGDPRDDEWFDWKYGDNPYVDHVPIQVATNGEGEIVGARPLLAIPLVIDRTRRLALQPCDTMVHPDHRRQGLFTRMTERTVERYADDEAALFFNFPNERSQAGYEKLGWRPIGRIPTYYRLRRPSAWLPDGSRARTVGGEAANVLMNGYLRARRVATDEPDGIEIERHDAVPSEKIADLYATAGTSGIHAPRDREYLRWRYENPDWSYRFFLAYGQGEAVGAAIAGRNQLDQSRVQITDLVPLSPDDRVVSALVRAVIDTFDDADAIAAPPTLSSSVASAYGFRSDGDFPLSQFSTQTTLVARPANRDADAWTPDLQSASDAANWSVTFTEQDTS